MSPRQKHGGRVPGKALWAFFISGSCGLCVAQCVNRTGQPRGQCDPKATRSREAGPALLQVVARRSRGGSEEDADADQRFLQDPGTDDDSQISVPGPPLTLEEALRLLGDVRALALDQGGRGMADEGLRRGLDGIAVVYVSGRPDFDAALRDAVLQYVPMGGIFKTEGKMPGNFIGALDYAFKKFPSAAWYYIADDDSFVHLERLAQLASTFDAASKQYVGHRDCAGAECKVDVKCRREDMLSPGGRNPGWACGGPGVLLSRPLVEAMAASSCGEYYAKEPAPVCCGDMALACCAFDAWEGLEILDAPALLPYPAVSNLTFVSDDMVAVHKLLPNITLKLGSMYNAHLARA